MCTVSISNKHLISSFHVVLIWLFEVITRMVLVISHYSTLTLKCAKLLYFYFFPLRMHQTNNARCVDLLWRHILSIILLGIALSVSYSR